MNAAQNRITWWQYAYYIVLLLIITSWTDTMSSPPLVMRLAFMAALFIVPIFSGMSQIPAVMTCFFIVSSFGFSNSYLPSSYYLYCIPIILCLFISNGNRCNNFQIPKLFIVLCVYTFIINGITSLFVQNLTYCYLILISFILFADTERTIDFKLVVTYLTIATIVLSLYFFVFGNEFTQSYSETAQLERTGWTDANYFSTTLGFSVLASAAMLLTTKNNWLEKSLYIVNIVMSVSVMVLVASRGGILSLAAGIIVLLFLSKVKKLYKILFTLLLVAFVLYLFNNDYFQLLQYRIEMDEGTGSGRTDIWLMKLRGFFDSSPLVWLFGMGFMQGSILGGTANYYSCFHNDFLAYLVCYGIVGLVMFILLLCYPIRHSNRKHSIFPVILALVVYLAVTSLTLQPLCEGYLGYFCYYFLILMLMQFSNTDTLQNE